MDNFLKTYFAKYNLTQPEQAEILENFIKILVLQLLEDAPGLAETDAEHIDKLMAEEKFYEVCNYLENKYGSGPWQIILETKAHALLDDYVKSIEQ